MVVLTFLVKLVVVLVLFLIIFVLIICSKICHILVINHMSFSPTIRVVGGVVLVWVRVRDNW
jgi:hypothetical protein